METVIRIRNLYDAAIKSLKSGGKDKSYKKLLDHNNSIMRDAFRRIMAGEIKGLHYISETSFKYYHRSTKQENTIQLSSGFYRDGELYPCYDVQMKTPDDLLREGYPSGLWEIVY